MESFLEPATVAPEPTPIEKYILSQAVPEVSMISNTKPSLNKYSSEENIWKMKQETQRFSGNLQPHHQIPIGYKNLQAQFTKKQVRFESPTMQQTQKVLQPVSETCGTERATKYSDFSAIRNQHISEVPSKGSKPFEQIYMANIPDRKLDLSIIDLPNVGNNIKKMTIENTPSDHQIHEEIEEKKKDVQEVNNVKDDELHKKCTENKENEMPKSYQDFLELQKKITSKRKLHNDSVTDIFNYKRNSVLNQQQSIPSPNTIPSDYLRSQIQEKYDKFFDTGYQNQCQTYQQKHTPQIPLDHNIYPHQSPFQALQSYKPFSAPVMKQTCNIETQTSPEKFTEIKTLERPNCEPNNTDLLKIIAQQNEQLLILQKQVAMLLERDRNYPKPLGASTDQDRNNVEINKYATVSTPQKNHFRQENTITKQASIFQDNQRKWGMSKFSINLTTSFDMPLRTQQKQNFVYNEPKIQEITESDFSPKNDNLLEHSIHLQDPLDVREQCPSPQPSININMNDYESSDDEVSAAEIGATFYNNLMGQVNNILKKAQIDTEDLRQKGGFENDRNKTLNKVREATLKHLKSIGINVDDQRELVTPDNAKNYSPSEISLTVKQLLMKYLPVDKIKQERILPVSNEAVGGILEARPEFSLASLEYMRKYNLISSKEKVPQIIEPQKVGQKDCNYMDSNRRILDLTALKMQPKLL